MKKLICISILAAAMPLWLCAQDKVKTEVKKDANKAAHKTEEVASKAKAKVTDKTYADKVGPDGQTIYIDKHSKYYWIDSRGHKKYVSKAMLKDK